MSDQRFDRLDNRFGGGTVEPRLRHEMFDRRFDRFDNPYRGGRVEPHLEGTR
jgi:hypothetical protein